MSILRAYFLSEEVMKYRLIALIMLIVTGSCSSICHAWTDKCYQYANKNMMTLSGMYEAGLMGMWVIRNVEYLHEPWNCARLRAT
jgi:hypothetical protein